MFRSAWAHGGPEELMKRFAHEGFGFGPGEGPFGKFGRHGGPGRGGRHGRPFGHGDLRYVLLKLIADQPRHGYDLIKAIEEQFSGTYSPSPGVVYPTLTWLEELGYVSASQEGSKKLYTITEEGTAFLETNRSLVETLFARMQEASARFGGPPSHELMHALHDLKHAVKYRMGKGLTPEQAEALTELLKRTVTDIERL